MPMPKFEPTPEMREVVRALSAAGKSKEFISRVVVNPVTKRPIGVKTLDYYFATELHDATVELLVMFYRNIKEALEAKEKWATVYTGDNIAGFKAIAKDAAAPEAVKNIINTIVIKGVGGKHRVLPGDGARVVEHQRALPNQVRAEDLHRSEPRMPRPEHQLPPHSGPIIDSRSEEFIRPIAQEVPDDAAWMASGSMRLGAGLTRRIKRTAKIPEGYI
jgi:hypothetical protein